jgi:hypothetical protein
VTKVVDMRDPSREMVFDLEPRRAVVAAHAHDRGDGNTWEHEERYGSLVEEGRWHLFCGDFAARKEQPC